MPDQPEGKHHVSFGALCSSYPSCPVSTGPATKGLRLHGASLEQETGLPRLQGVITKVLHPERDAVAEECAVVALSDFRKLKLRLPLAAVLPYIIPKQGEGCSGAIITKAGV